MTVRFISDEKIAETSSKGNQEKWNQDGRWYKLDQFGYEALSETFTSMLLQDAQLERQTPFTFVRYRMERVHAHGHDRTGCSSDNFLQPGQSIITLAHLYKRCLDQPLHDVLARQRSDKKRIAYLAEMTAELTGLSYFPQYLALLFEVDAWIVNDDRHLNNIAVLEQSGVYDYCPIFDNGAGLLSNTQVLPMDIDPTALIRSMQARPFSTTFNRQIATTRSLYGRQLALPQFNRKQLIEQLQPLLVYYPMRDRGVITDRVCETILLRQKFG